MTIVLPQVVLRVLILWYVVLKKRNKRFIHTFRQLFYLKAYTAGYNIVILSGDFQRVQVLLSGNETNQCLLTCIDCTYESGKVSLVDFIISKGFLLNC